MGNEYLNVDGLPGQAKKSIPKDKKLLERNTNIFKDIVTKTFSNHATIKTLENMRDILLPKLMNGEIRIKI